MALITGTISSPPAAAVARLLATLDAEQRAAALLPDGPALIIAPAGSGKTTTLVARLGVLLERGVPASEMAVVTFNRAAAGDLAQRISRQLVPALGGGQQIEVRTLHGMARQVLLDAGLPVRLVADRMPLVRAARRRVMGLQGPDAPPPPEAAGLDTVISAWKVERRQPPAAARPVVDEYAALLALRGELDFDDLVVNAVEALERDHDLRTRWQQRFSHLAVDEFQDVDAAQFALVRLLAAPTDNLFVVGDDDQTIYAWRLADVRRILDFETYYPTATRIQLVTNYRCPRRVVAASAQLVAVNTERFAKRIRAAPERRGGGADEVAVLPMIGPDGPDRVATAALRAAADGERCCVLARTRAELIPVQAALLRAGVAHASPLTGPLDSTPVQTMLAAARRLGGSDPPFPSLLRIRSSLGLGRGGENDNVGDEDHAAMDALLGWAAAFRTLDAFVMAAASASARIAALRDQAAPLELATVHGSKGREWETVLLIGFEDELFPNRRALQDTADPIRALESERRLAYVALTRASRRLILAFDPARPSPFYAEMGYRPTSAATTFK